MARNHPAERKPDESLDDEIADSMDVPAAVVCAVCGSGECPGCTYESTTTSGVVAIVPWERPEVAPFARFFGTVQATTRGAETFFSALPDGSVWPALLFAVLAETCAVGSTAALVAPMVVAAIPGLLLRCMTSGSTRQIVLLASAVGVVGFTALLVAAHAVYGLSLGRSVRRRALRFGLYACGCDFASSPAGVLTAALSRGTGSMLSLFVGSMTAPRRATDAALEGIYQVRGAAADRARLRAMWIAMALTVPAVVIVLALIAATALLV